MGLTNSLLDDVVNPADLASLNPGQVDVLEGHLEAQLLKHIRNTPALKNELATSAKETIQRLNKQR